MSVEIEPAREASAELVEAAARLLPQLSARASVPGRAELAEIVASAATELLLARSGGTIVGMLTLVWFRTPTGVHALVEDVVVDAAARGAGVGEALVRAALARARERGATAVDLTSRPQREAANRLYQRLGFEPRHTNLYRFTL